MEPLLAAALFVLIIGAFTTGLLNGQENIKLSGQRSRAILLAEESMSAVKAIKNENYSLLTPGTFGLTYNTNLAKWELTSSILPQNGFTRSVTITNKTPKTKEILAKITWQQNEQRSAQLELTSIVSNWTNPQTPPPFTPTQADYLQINATQARLTLLNRLLTGITLTNSGTNPISVSQMTVAWTQNTTLSQITFNLTTAWSSGGVGTPSGFQTSPANLDITDQTLQANIAQILNLRWQGGVQNDTITITFIMIDGSRKTINVST